MRDALSERFATLFQGRLDALGTERGGSVRQLPPTWEHFVKCCYDHLWGGEPIGVYPMVPMIDDDVINHQVRWGCIDFDIKSDHHKSFDYETEYDAHTAAQNVVTVLSALGISGWIERTRSHGRHVWVFADGWIEAGVMRDALLAASQLAKTPTREVNPKNRTFDKASTLGNYVRLPYPYTALASQARRVYMPGEINRFFQVDDFLTQALEGRSGAHIFGEAAELYQPPVEKFIPQEAPAPMAGDAVGRMTGLSYTIWRDGPMEGSDRSGTLYKLAAQLKKDGRHTFGEVVDLVTDADLRWGKFYKRSDAQRYLHQMVEKVWCA